MDGSWWRVLTKCGPLEKGMANHFSIFALRIPMDRGAWRAMVHGVAKSWIQLDNKYTRLPCPSPTPGACEEATKKKLKKSKEDLKSLLMKVKVESEKVG